MKNLRLIKKENVDGKDCYKCAFSGTETCRKIHNNSSDCISCPILQHIFEKLYIYESIEYEK